MTLKTETCRVCNARADFIVWGKLFSPEDLGPRCITHLADGPFIDLGRLDQWAVYDLRPLNRHMDEEHHDQYGHRVSQNGCLLHDPRCSICTRDLK